MLSVESRLVRPGRASVGEGDDISWIFKLFWKYDDFVFLWLVSVDGAMASNGAHAIRDSFCDNLDETTNKYGREHDESSQARTGIR